MHVVAGGNQLYVNEGVEQRSNVDKIIGHENYDSSNINNDICLLKVKPLPRKHSQMLQYLQWRLVKMTE